MRVRKKMTGNRQIDRERERKRDKDDLKGGEKLKMAGEKEEAKEMRTRNG